MPIGGCLDCFNRCEKTHLDWRWEHSLVEILNWYIDRSWIMNLTKLKKKKIYWMPNAYCLIRSNQGPRDGSAGQSWEHELDSQNPRGKACYDSTHHSNLSNGEMETRGFRKCASQANFSRFGPVWGSVSELKIDGPWGTMLGGPLLPQLTRTHTCY